MNTEVSSTKGLQFVNSVGMLMTLISFSMLFATMFLGYAMYRFTSNTWPPMGMDKISLLYPLISTVIIVLSSVCYYKFEVSFNKINLMTSRLLFSASFLLGILFLCSQYKLWQNMHTNGLYASSGIFPSLIYAFTWVHAFHIVVALLALLYVIPVLTTNDDKSDIDMRIQNVGKFWHFLGVIWVMIFISVFVL